MPGSSADVAIIGAGVVGAAVGLALTDAGLGCVILERKGRAGGEITERNSGVVHAGLNHPLAWLKTRLCVEGNRALFAFAEKAGVPHRRTGKLIVATTTAEVEALEALHVHGCAAGVDGLSLLTAQQLVELESGVRGRAALLSASTGIVDPVELTAALLAAARAGGAEVVVAAEVRELEPEGAGWRLDTARGKVWTSAVVNAAGLQADEVARLAGVDRYHIHPCRGDYYRWRTPRTFSRLVYPVKAGGGAGLGVHLTIDLNGGLRFGPDAHYVSARDDYRPGPDARAAFASAAARIIPGVLVEDLAYDSAGIRPKLRAPGDPEERDFVIAEDRPGLINLVGIESPGLTAALAIGREVHRLLRP